MSFNESQKRAIAHIDHPCLVLAGPGSGKTTVITQRTAHLIESGIDPASILVVTFTKAAAQEMKSRFLKLCMENKAKDNVMFCTFHSVFFMILRRSFGFKKDSVASIREKTSYFRDIFFRFNIHPRHESTLINDLLTEFSKIKGAGIDLDEFSPISLEKDLFDKVFIAYSQRMSLEQKLDFDDMQGVCLQKLLNNPIELGKWQDRFQYILIDEFQDINPVQYRLVKLLAAPQNNLFVVGDDDQSIYGFRGSDPSIMLGFPKDYPDTQKIVLNINYRSDKNVVLHATRLISANKNRFKKNIETSSSEEGSVEFFEHETSREEAAEVALSIKRSYEKGLPYSENVVLFRTNVPGGAFASEFEKKGIPFKMKMNVENPYYHFVSRDIFAYLRLSEGTLFRKDLIRVLNRPERSIPRESVNDAVIDPADWLFSLASDNYVHKKAVKLVSGLVHMGKMSLYARVNFIRHGMGYDDYLKKTAKEKGIDFEKYLEIAEFIGQEALRYNKLESWEEDISLISERIENKASSGNDSEDEDAVVLSSMHASKGLEYDTVYIADTVEGVIPYGDNTKDNDLEEERRLFYVALTRAKKNIRVCFVRTIHNHEVKPSRFIAEMTE